MMRSASLVSFVLLAIAGAVALAAEEPSPPSAAPVPAVAPVPVAAPKPPVPSAAPAPAPKPVVAVEKPKLAEKPAEKPAVPSPASPPAEPERSGDMPMSRETKPGAEPAVALNGIGAYTWPAFSFAMLILGFVAGYAWRHHVSRHKLGGMTVRIGTWRGTP